MGSHVIHERRQHYVVQTRSTRPGGPDVFCVRRQGPVHDKSLARISGPAARGQAIAMADAIASDADLTTGALDEASPARETASTSGGTWRDRQSAHG